MNQRPTLTDPAWLHEARDAVDAFVAGLQAGLEDTDAEIYNADFAEDVMWGSPYGATVLGYNTLHSIHRAMHEQGVPVTGPASRYQTEHVMAPTPDVAIAHVRRVALDEDGEQIPIDDESVFSEMAMYVLVRRNDKWWLAAGQNTPIRPKP